MPPPPEIRLRLVGRGAAAGWSSRRAWTPSANQLTAIACKTYRGDGSQIGIGEIWPAAAYVGTGPGTRSSGPR
jgi:hypothetical protein